MWNDKMNGDPPPGWRIYFERYEPDDEGGREVVLALGNGLFVTRAALTDARSDALHYPGTYHAGCYNRLPNRIAGESDETESLVNLPNWLCLSFRIGSEAWFSLDCADILEYSHVLNMRTGTAHREFRICDAQGRYTQICESRLVSMHQPNLCAIRYRFTPLDWSGPVEFRSAIDGDVVNDNVRRYENYAHRHLEEHAGVIMSANEAALQCVTSHSRIRIVQAMRTECSDAGASIDMIQENACSIAHIVHAHAEPGKEIRLEKTVALATSLDFKLKDPLKAAQSALHGAGDFQSLHSHHASAWEEIWKAAGIDIEDPELACPLCFHAFHILQTISPHTFNLDAGVPARGWHGEGYHGHIFWDELYVLPFLNFRFPDLAKEALLYRYRRLDAARAAARKDGYAGAMYPWRSAGDGREVTPRHQKNLLNGQWMRDHTYRQRHIGSAIAFNIWSYYLATGDAEFLHDYGAEMLCEIARFWASIAQCGSQGGRYEIKGVIGPDEYHNAYPGRAEAGLDNNAYTNVMAAWTLCRAQDVLNLLPAERRARLIQHLGLSDQELRHWHEVSRQLYVPFHGNRIISQFDGFDRLEEFHPEMLPASLTDERTDWALQAMGRNADEFQVTKQADVLTLFYLLPEDEVIRLLAHMGYTFDRAAMLRTAHYYLARTTHNSSLSHVVYAGALAKVDPALSWKLYQQVLRTDLNPLKGESVAEGVHLGAMGGSLDILQRRYLGISAGVDALVIDPALPAELGKVVLEIRYRGALLHIESTGTDVHLTSDKSNEGQVSVICRGMRKSLAPGQSMQSG